MWRPRTRATALALVPCLFALAAPSQQSPQSQKPSDQLLVRLGPSGSAREDKKTLSVLMQLFEPETITADQGTTVDDLSRKLCGRTDDNWTAEVLKAHPTMTRAPFSETKTLVVPPCPFWRTAGKTAQKVTVPETGTLSHYLQLYLGSEGDNTLEAVAKINHRSVESLNAIQPGEQIKLPYDTAFNPYQLKKEYKANPDYVTTLLKSAPGYVGTIPPNNLSLIVAAANTDCSSPADDKDWPFSTERLRKVLEYNNTRRSPQPLRKAVIAVADTGLESSDNRLRLFLNVNFREKPDNHVDDDNNGYVDDVYGANMDGNIEGFPALDEEYKDREHGTHISGLALGGLKDPELTKLVKERIALQEINIVYKRVMQPPTGGPYNDFTIPINFMIDAFKYAARDPGAQIINLSVEAEQSSGLEQTLAINQALVVAAAGNEGININEIARYPAAAINRTTLITVAAHDASGKLAGFSNWSQDKVDLAAPGCQIDSILPGGKRGKVSGTSQAAPLVSFTAGLLYSEWLTIPQIKNRILTTTDNDPASLGNCAGKHGGCVSSKGRLDIVKALRVYEDVLVLQDPGGPQTVVAGRIQDQCIRMDGRCLDVRTKLQRLTQDPATHQWQVWIKSPDDQLSSRQTEMEATIIHFQETESQNSKPIDLSKVVDLVTAVY